jgi:hypothetical protein
VESHHEPDGGWIGPAAAFVVVLGFVAPWAAPLSMWVLIASVLPWLVARVSRVRPTTRRHLTVFGVTAALLVGPVRDTVTRTASGMWERKLYSLGSDAVGAVTGLPPQLTFGHYVAGVVVAAGVTALASRLVAVAGWPRRRSDAIR